MGGAGDGAARLTVFGGLPRILKQDPPQFHFAASVYACLDEDGMPGMIRVIVLGVVVGWTGVPPAASAQSPAPRPTLNLELRNMTTLSPAVLAEARETLTQIYHAAGIGVQWKTVGADFTVFVISRPPHAVQVSSFALGYVPNNKARRGRQAFVLADRIRDRSSELVVSFQLVLGLTMAHEVAHLLLPYQSHSVDGLMGSAWNASDYLCWAWSSGRLGYRAAERKREPWWPRAQGWR